MRYYDFVPSRWIACDHQKAAFDKHQNEKLTGAEGEQSDGFLYTPPMPYFDEEYLEYTELLTSVMEARKTFTLIELGARWGTWCQRAWATIKNLRPGLEFHVYPNHSQKSNFLVHDGGIGPGIRSMG